MRISDCSSDVCSSDRLHMPTLDALGYLPDQAAQIDRAMLSDGGAVVFAGAVGSGKSTCMAVLIAGLQIGSASCRDRVCRYVSLAVVAGALYIQLTQQSSLVTFTTHHTCRRYLM